MRHSVQTFAEWLAATPLSELIKNVEWIIPAVQTIHILAIALVMSAVFVVDLNALGILVRTQPLAGVAHRFLPWIWWLVLVLLVSGGILIIGEPERSLTNPAFIAKMAMLCVVLSLTLGFQRGLRRDGQFWQSSLGRRVGGRVLAVISLALWIGILVSGRWIAYYVDAV